MPRSAAAVMLLLSLGTLTLTAGCTAEASRAGSAPSVSEPPTPAAPVPAVTPGASVEASGAIAKAPGEAAVLVAADDSEAVFTLRVRSITPMASCPGQFSRPPENGVYVVLDVEADLGGAVAANDLMFIGPAMWQVAGEDGVVDTSPHDTDAAFQCFETQERAPYAVGRGESVSGLVVLDSSVASGTVRYAPSGRAYWEWRFGS